MKGSGQVEVVLVSRVLPGCGDENEEEAALAVEDTRRLGLNFGGSLKGTESKKKQRVNILLLEIHSRSLFDMVGISFSKPKASICM